MVNVSIIIPVYNAEKTIMKCIDSLLDQDFPKKQYEIIAVNNNSNDNTSSILNKYKEKIIILNEKRKGPSHARNKGIEKSKGNLILFIDSDCFAQKNWIKETIKPFKKKNVKIVSGKVLASEKRGPIQKYCNKFFHTQKKYANAKRPFCATANAAIRKSALKNNLFNENFYPSEDLELCLRIIKKGNELLYNNKSVVFHYYPESILFFMSNAYRNGKNLGIIKKELNSNHFIPGIKYNRILKKYGLRMLSLKILYDLVFRFSYFYHIIL